MIDFSHVLATLVLCDDAEGRTPVPSAAIVLIKHMNIYWLLNGQKGHRLDQLQQPRSISLNMDKPLNTHLLTECMTLQIRA